MLPSRGAGRAKRESSLRKATYVPALTATPASDSDSSLSPYDAQDDPAAVPHEDPVAPLRRVNVVLQFVGAGMLALGSTLVVSLYVTGPPRLSDIDSSMTAVLLTIMVVGAAALLILLGKKPEKDMPPPHPRWLRAAALLAFFLAMLYVIAGLTLFILLERIDAFVAFCMKNIPHGTAENCEERFQRAWAILLAVFIVFIFHVALGFPVYRYTRGSKYGVQVKNSAFLLEPGRRQRRRAASEGRTARGIWSSDSDPELDAFIQDELARRNAQGTRYWRPRSERGGELEQQSLGKEGAKRKKTKRRSRRREALGG